VTLIDFFWKMGKQSPSDAQGSQNTSVFLTSERTDIKMGIIPEIY
jgi:hypothetical protein